LNPKSNLKRVTHKLEMACLARRTDDTLTQKFGDGRHNFYIELRCGRKALPTMEVCELCAVRNPAHKIQVVRRFDHGLVSEPIPDQSHIFGGRWYQEKCEKWGKPSAETIKFALMYQREAREGFDVVDEVHKDEDPVIDKPVKMPPRKKKTMEQINAELEAATVQLGSVTVKRKRPRVVTEAPSQPKEELKEPEPQPQQQPVKKRAPRAKKAPEDPTPILPSSVAYSPINYKAITFATHIEKDIQEVDLDGLDIEYIKLSQFQVGDTTYYREPVKQKLYKRLSDKSIGPYVGRYNAQTSVIDIDIPDSDEE
jgi:hypothetical protein